MADTGEEAKDPCSWTLRLEGQLENAGRNSKVNPKPLSHYISSVIFQLGKEDDVVEWTKGPGTLETEGFEIRRCGNVNVPVKIVLVLDEQPKRFKPSTELVRVLEKEKDVVSKPAAVLAVWQYVKVHKLQESDEKKMVRCDETLQSVFKIQQMSFSDIPKLIEPHLLPLKPIVLDYLVSMDQSEDSLTWELEIEVDDPGKIRPIAANIVAQQREIGLLEHRIHEVSNALKAAAIHERILRFFAADPLQCIGRLMDAQCADQKVVSGESSSITVNDLYRASTFDNEEFEKAIALYCANDPMIRRV